MPNTELMNARLRFLEIDAATIDHLKDAFEILEPAMGRLMDDFYRHLMQEPELQVMFQHEDDIKRARLAQEKHWIEAMLRGRYDNAYFLKAEKIGRAHARMGLTPNWYIGAYSHMLNLFSNTICEHFDHDAGRAQPLIQALTKIVFLDIDLVIHTYLEAKSSFPEM